MGHDPPMSIVDDYGPNFPSPMQLDMLPIDVLSNLAFFFGGVGDGTKHPSLNLNMTLMHSNSSPCLRLRHRS